MKPTRRLPLWFVILAVTSLLSSAGGRALAAVRLPKVFSDNMVLHRDRPVPMWGWANPGEEVAVTVGSQPAVSTKADDQGSWRLELPAMPAGGPHVITIKGEKPLALKNVLFGDIWVCSGQSNMQWSVARASDAEKEIAAANHANLRLFSVKTQTAVVPAEDVESQGWQVCAPDTVKDFTAVGYFFGRELLKELKDVPIGLINTSWGGTLIEPWTPPVGFAAVPKTQQIADQIEQADRDYVKALGGYLDQRAKWVASAKDATVAEAAKLPPQPVAPKHGFADTNRAPTVIYNAMVYPLVPFAITGAIWYQGESNSSMGDGMLYFEKMKALIQGWRTLFKSGEFPFLYVQLAPYQYKIPAPDGKTRLPEVWQAQLTSLSIPNTGMAVTTDIGNVQNIHPTNKQEVGRRLALWALVKQYGRKGLVYSGPLYKSMSVEGAKIRVRFDHVGGGLASHDGQPLTWFQIAGEDQNFVEAKAVIDGDTVLVSSETVKQPTAVRFGWSDTAEPNLMNKEGLPASPFKAGK